MLLFDNFQQLYNVIIIMLYIVLFPQVQTCQVKLRNDCCLSLNELWKETILCLYRTSTAAVTSKNSPTKICQNKNFLYSIILNCALSLSFSPVCIHPLNYCHLVSAVSYCLWKQTKICLTVPLTKAEFGQADRPTTSSGCLWIMGNRWKTSMLDNILLTLFSLRWDQLQCILCVETELTLASKGASVL